MRVGVEGIDQGDDGADVALGDQRGDLGIAAVGTYPCYSIQLRAGLLKIGRTTMLKTVGVTELQRQFRSIFEEVVVGNVPYVLTRGSKPEAVLVSYEEFMRLQEQDYGRRFDELVQQMTEKNAGYTEDEVMDEVKAAIQEVREQYPE